MRIFIYILIIIYLSSVPATAQKLAPAISASSIFIGGVSGNTVGWEVAPGVSYKWLSAGAAYGVERYEEKTHQFSGWLRAYAKQKTTTPFVYFQLGSAVPDIRQHVYQVSSYSETTNYKPALFCDLGLGYRVQLYRKLAINFSAGYSVKNTKTVVTWTGYDTRVPPAYIPISETREHVLRRIAFRAGLSF